MILVTPRLRSGEGVGGHFKHIDISWMDKAPTYQVANLDQCRAPKRYGQHFYRHIDESWYLHGHAAVLTLKGVLLRSAPL